MEADSKCEARGSVPRGCTVDHADAECDRRAILEHLADGQWHDLDTIHRGVSKTQRKQAIWALQSKGTDIDYKRESGRSYYRLTGAIGGSALKHWPRGDRDFRPVAVETDESAANESPDPEAKKILSRLWVKAPLSEYRTGELLTELARRGWELSPCKRWVSELRTGEESD